MQTLIGRKRAQVRVSSRWLALPWRSFCYSHPSDQKIATLNKVVHELRNQLATSQRTANQEKHSLNETISALRADLRTRDDCSNTLLVQLADAQHKADSLIRINHAHEQKHRCESLYAQGHIGDAAECLLKIANTIDNDVRENKLLTDWLSGEFRCRALG